MFEGTSHCVSKWYLCMSTLTKLKVSLALVSIITCLAAEKIESSLFGFMLAQNTRSPTLKWCGSACCLLSWYSFKRAGYRLHFDRCSRSSADSAYLNWTARCTVVLFESWRLNKTILGAFPLILFGLMAFKTFRSNDFLESIVLIIDPSVCAKVCGIARWTILWQQQNKCIRNILHMAKFVSTPKNIISERSSSFRYCFSELDLDNVDSWEM